MKKNELISMVDFVLGNLTSDAHYSCHLMQKYANFLNTPLNISQFVPAIWVGDKWEALEEPELCCSGSRESMCGCGGFPINYTPDELKQYQTAKEQCLFEGFEVLDFDFTSNSGVFNCKKFGLSGFDLTIQDLIKYKPTLTKKGIELSGLNNK